MNGWFPRRYRARSQKKSIPAASFRTWSGAWTARSRDGIHPTRSRVRQAARLGRQSEVQTLRGQQRQTKHSYPKSTPCLRVDSFGVLFNKTANPSSLLTQMLQFAHMFRPRLFSGLGIGRQLVSHCFCHKLAERNSPLGRLGLSAPKNGIRHLQCGFHEQRLPYLWEQVNESHREAARCSYHRSRQEECVSRPLDSRGQVCSGWP